MDNNLSAIIQFYIEQLKSNKDLNNDIKDQYLNYLNRYAEAVLSRIAD